MKTVTVFGSSYPREGDEEYSTAYDLGRQLSLNGFNVCTGGYGGIMDAVSKGASENGREAIGVTVEVFKSSPSRYLTGEIRTKNLLERIRKLIEIGDAYIVLRGGTGTLVELAMVWEFMNKSLLPIKPFACHGRMWIDIVNNLNERMGIENRKTNIIRCFDDISSCGNYITKSLKMKFE
jgi:uncharacterized protein (TIGR00730 family)